MATRFHLPVRRRAPVPLTADDVARLQLLRESAAMRRALHRLSDDPVAGDAVSPTEAALLHAVLEAGWRALEADLEEVGYAALGRERHASADERRAAARRREPSWSAET
jgi:hypothetical protein